MELPKEVAWRGRASIVEISSRVFDEETTERHLSKRSMTYPKPRDWLFSLKTFVAAVIALAIAFYFDLPRPYWAMASVYIVSNPFVGATRSKALYRALGTVLGAIAAVVLVPPFAESPLILSAFIASWTGIFVYLSITTRAARSYIFLLASYSLSIIAFPSVTNPESIFDIAVSRVEEITLGIICASVVGSVVFPSRLSKTLIGRTDSWFKNAIEYTGEALAGRTASGAVARSRQGMAVSIRDLELLLSQLKYDRVSPIVLLGSDELKRRMQIMFPIISSLADTLSACFESGVPERDVFRQLVNDIGVWVVEPLDLDPEHGAPFLRASIAAQEVSVDKLASWEEVLFANGLWWLRQLVDIWSDCRTLRTNIDHGGGSWQPHFNHWRLTAQRPYFDKGLAMFSAGCAAFVVFLSACLWILSGWEDGAAAVSLGATGSCFFASLDEPVPMMRTFLACSGVGMLLAGFYLFAVLPNVHDFPLLIIFLGIGFIPLGSLMPQPTWAQRVTVVALSTATFLGISSAYDANFLNFLNSNTAGLAGVIFASVVTGLIRPIGTDIATSRLTNASWRDVVIGTATQGFSEQCILSARMLDHLLQLIPRVSSEDELKHPAAESLRDMRIALNASDLRRLSANFNEKTRSKFAAVLDGIREYYELCISANDRQRAHPKLLIAIEEALYAATDPLEYTNILDILRRRKVVHSLVGIKLSFMSRL